MALLKMFASLQSPAGPFKHNPFGSPTRRPKAHAKPHVRCRALGKNLSIAMPVKPPESATKKARLESPEMKASAVPPAEANGSIGPDRLWGGLWRLSGRVQREGSRLSLSAVADTAWAYLSGFPFKMNLSRDHWQALRAVETRSLPD